MLKKIGFFVLIAAGSATAEVYKWVDAEGVTHYSSNAPKGNQQIKAVDVQTEYTPPTAPTYQMQSAPTMPSRDTTNYTRKIENQNTYSEWQECAATKRRAIIAEKRRARTAEQLNEWLWKNCRGYSNELREIEREMM